MGDIAEHDAGEWYVDFDPFRASSMGAVIGTLAQPNDVDHVVADALRARERRRIAELARLKLLQLEKLGVDELGDGTIVRIVKPIAGKGYTYAAVRANGRWYVTGRISKSLSHVEFCTWLLSGEGFTDWAVQRDAPANEEMSS